MTFMKNSERRICVEHRRDTKGHGDSDLRCEMKNRFFIALTILKITILQQKTVCGIIA